VEQFQDPALFDLVRTALENNKDLQIATATVDQASHSTHQRSALAPQGRCRPPVRQGSA